MDDPAPRNEGSLMQTISLNQFQKNTEYFFKV